MADWLPINGAPRDGSTILVYVRGHIEFASGVLSAHWDAIVAAWLSGGANSLDAPYLRRYDLGAWKAWIQG